MQSRLSMHLSPRCGARTRTGRPCRSPAMADGRCRNGHPRLGLALKPAGADPAGAQEDTRAGDDLDVAKAASLAGLMDAD